MAAPVEPARRAAGPARHRRCRSALACEPADRAPLYLAGVSCGVASALLGRPALAGTGSLHFAEVAAWAESEAAHAEFEARLFEDLVAVHRILEADVLRLPWRMNRRPDARLDEHTFRFGPEAGEHTVWQYQPATGDFSPIYISLPTLPPEQRLRQTVERLEATLGDAQAVAQEVAPLIRLERDFGEEFFVIGVSAHIGVGLASEDLELLVTEPDLVRHWCLLQADFAIAVGRALVAADCPAVILGGGDLAGNLGPFYSPAMFRALVLPAYVKALTGLNALGVHYIFRSDGNLWPLMDMVFGDAGCPGYGETDRDASMTVAAVRARFPRLVIWGNVSSALTARGTAEQVRTQARDALAEAGGRGYFQGCSNALILGTPPENVRALCGVR